MRARELGVAPGIFDPGPLNAITDVGGVRVGHATVVEGDAIRTGVTAVLPHGANLYLDRVPAAIHVGNGFGKLVGSTQVRELGELETPLLLTSTLCVFRAADALVEWMLAQPGMEEVRSLNPVVGETNDGVLNAIRLRPITAEHVRAALASAREGPVPEGCVGAGTGTVAFGWKGGIGTASRVLPASLGGACTGVLVQSNFGGVLQVMGAPVGEELGRYASRSEIEPSQESDQESSQESSQEVEPDQGGGSILIVIATDAPLSDRNLGRLAARAILGLSRTGSSAANGSGDYAVAFSTSASVRRPSGAKRLVTTELANEEMSALFQAVIEATEEAIYDSLFTAETTAGNGRTVEAIPLDRVREVLSRYGVPRRDGRSRRE
ncbi:P1 family peptidase [Sorangium sp. So ce1014]|uniref:DmpA family aminopeptidase n=1 Tax=Sorangium sp. So ce1014 TaxID=3133326 RepID=UPI003F60B2CC